MRVAVIDYGSGNLRSVTKAFERAAREAGVAAAIELTAVPEHVAAADRVVLPGVGAFADCRSGLAAIPGMLEALTQAVVAGARPFLGICVGMQLMATWGHEKMLTSGLGWVEGDVVRLQPQGAGLKVPHIGWNTLKLQRSHPLFTGVPTGPAGLHAYFVHSYHLQARDPEATLALTEYGGPVTAAVVRGNMAGTQFHPEKSQQLGLTLIANFLKWSP